MVEVARFCWFVAGGDVADAVDELEGAAEWGGGEAAELGDVEDAAGLVGQEATEQRAGLRGELADQCGVDGVLAVAGDGGFVVQAQQGGQGDGDPDVEPAPAGGVRGATQEPVGQDVGAGLGQPSVVVGVVGTLRFGGQGQLALDQQGVVGRDERLEQAHPVVHRRDGHVALGGRLAAAPCNVLGLDPCHEPAQPALELGQRVGRGVGDHGLVEQLHRRDLVQAPPGRGDRAGLRPIELTVAVGGPHRRQVRREGPGRRDQVRDESRRDLELDRDLQDRDLAGVLGRSSAPPGRDRVGPTTLHERQHRRSLRSLGPPQHPRRIRREAEERVRRGHVTNIDSTSDTEFRRVRLGAKSIGGSGATRPRFSGSRRGGS